MHSIELIKFSKFDILVLAACKELITKKKKKKSPNVSQLTAAFFTERVVR